MGPEWFRAQRDERGWTKAEASRFAGVHRSTWGRWEDGTLVPTPSTQLVLRQLFEGASIGDAKGGDWYRVRRAAKEQTQAEAATAIGVNPGTYLRWESEAMAPRLEHMRGIADWAGMEMGEVMEALR
jgi:DNA-binding XRE family transcriptional regulator